MPQPMPMPGASLTQPEEPYLAPAPPPGHRVTAAGSPPPWPGPTPTAGVPPWWLLPSAGHAPCFLITHAAARGSGARRQRVSPRGAWAGNGRGEPPWRACECARWGCGQAARGSGLVAPCLGGVLPQRRHLRTLHGHCPPGACWIPWVSCVGLCAPSQRHLTRPPACPQPAPRCLFSSLCAEGRGKLPTSLFCVDLLLYELDGDPKRKEFLDDLFSFMQKRGTPVNRIPIMAKQVLDLFMLYVLVTEKGGLVEVINKKLWREITKGLNLPTSITSAAFTLRTQYMKYLYPYECEKRGLSNPNELQAAIDSNRREGRRQSFGGSLFAYSPGGAHGMLSSPKLPVSSLGLAASTNGSSITPAPKIKKEEDSTIPITVPGRLPVSLAGHPVVAAQAAAVQAAAAQAAVAAQAAALEQLREKLESAEPPEKKMALVADEQQRLMQRALQQNFLAMAAQLPMSIRINSQASESRQDSAVNLTGTNGSNSISMSVEINGIMYTGVLFAQPPAPTPPSASNKGGGGSGSSNAGGRGGNTGTSGGQAGPAGLSGPSTSTSNNSLP
uniref:AT-rich interactive domain-containing protein 3A isoform X2 n=1 Tax=Macaca mulatta TaxID=9544 RepID=UPI0010A2884D|nr:AT-rich interactive domain-containing protein 3A isoform X2 [Macaca mulatta]